MGSRSSSHATHHPTGAVEDGQTDLTTTSLELEESPPSHPTHTPLLTLLVTPVVRLLLLLALDPALLEPVRELFRRLSVMLDPSLSVSVLHLLPSDSTRKYFNMIIKLYLVTCYIT